MSNASCGINDIWKTLQQLYYCPDIKYYFNSAALTLYATEVDG